MLFVKGWFGCATLKGFNFNIRRYLKEVLVCVTLRLLGLVTSLKKLVTRSVSSSSHLTVGFMSSNCETLPIVYGHWLLPSLVNLSRESSQKPSDGPSLTRAKACHTSSPHSTCTSAQGLGSPRMDSAQNFCHENQETKGKKFPHFSLKKK